MKEIFVVEDDIDIRELVDFLLTDQGYKVETFATAEDFETRLYDHHPDLILLDIRLPDGDGADICVRIKTEQDTASIPVILMSAHLDPTVLEPSCGDDFIQKPFDIEDLSVRISRQLI